jgi:hypothetical protein
VRIVLEHLLRDMPCKVADSLISPASPDSARSVMNVCRLSCQRPSTFASSLTLAQAVLNVVIGFVGSVG